MSAVLATTSRNAPGRRHGLPLAALPSRTQGSGLDAVSSALVQSAPLRVLLIQSALLAELHGLQGEVEKIRRVVLALGVNQVLFDVARAIVALHRADAAASATIVERDVLLADPGHELGRAVLICAWRQMGRTDWAVHANALLATTTNDKVQRMLMQTASTANA
jgi:hypothetical protein